jgi:hypothetical protein
MTDSYVGSAGSVGTGSIGLPSGALGTADDDMGLRKRDDVDITGDVPEIANGNTGPAFTPSGTGVGMDEGGMASAGGTGAPGVYYPTPPTAAHDRSTFGTPGATEPTPTTAGTTGTMGTTVGVTDVSGTFGRGQESTDPTVLTTGAMETSAAPMGTGAASTGVPPMGTSELFREEYERRFSNIGMSYDQALPAFEYGHRMRSESGEANTDWNVSEQRLREDWESRSPGTWLMYRDLIRTGWEHPSTSSRTGQARML